MNNQNFNKENLAFWTKTSNLDRMVCRAKGISFDETLAKSLENGMRHYFALNKQGEYKVVSGMLIEPYRVKERGSKKFHKIYIPLEDCKIETDDVKKAIKEYCLSVHNVNVLV